MHWDEKILSNVNSKLEEFLYSSTHGNECNNYEISPRAFLLPVNNSLRKLQLEGAQLNSSVFKEILMLNDFSSLTHLDVERNSLEDIPNLKTNLSNLEKLFVGHNPNLSCKCPTLYNLQDMKDVLYLDEYKKVKNISEIFDTQCNKTAKICREEEGNLQRNVLISILVPLFVICTLFITFKRHYLWNHCKTILENTFTCFYHHKILHRTFKDDSEMDKKWDVALFYHVPNSSVQTTIQRLNQCDRCEIFGFFLLWFPQNERKMYLFCSIFNF